MRARVSERKIVYTFHPRGCMVPRLVSLVRGAVALWIHKLPQLDMGSTCIYFQAAEGTKR